MVVSRVTLCFFTVFGAVLPVIFPGNFSLSHRLTSATLSLPPKSLLTCQSLETRNITTHTLTSSSQITVQDLQTDLLLANNDLLYLSGVVQITGEIRHESEPISTSFVQKSEEKKPEFASFLTHNNRKMSDLEDQLNRVGLGVYRSFLEIPAETWTLHAEVEGKEGEIGGLPEHRKVMVRTNVYFTSPEWAGEVVTLHVSARQVNDVPVWQSSHSWVKAGCEYQYPPQVEMVAVTVPLREREVSYRFTSNMENRCGVTAPYALSTVLVYYR